MSNQVLQIGNIIGAILQPLYFCLFIFNVKEIKNKRILFVVLSILDYVLINKFVRFRLGINADLMFAIMFYVNLKFLYKSKARVTDIMTYVISNVLLGIISIMSYFIFGMNLLGLIFSLIMPIIIVILNSKKNK